MGDFNSWNPKEGSLSKLKNGIFKFVFSIYKDTVYKLKYVIDDAFGNELKADSFKRNEFAVLKIVF
ncbi:hypothetical protein [Flavobacterium sp. ACAM 123]|uniref:hypothetical protein n=1 Tax=Flavobacterium sp. ACAM 123 TaxID=1189620 RepID=UPI001E3D3654|nr:hypothetical protein [Flavobacterium sp. ACAM 123]